MKSDMASPELIEVVGSFDMETCKYDYTTLVYRSEGKLYIARHRERIQDELETGWFPPLSELYCVLEIPHAIWPGYDQEVFGQAYETPIEKCYVKRPTLVFYTDDDADLTANLMKSEATVYQKLTKSPHENLPSYLGCLVDQDRVLGLLLPKYICTLDARRKEKETPLDVEKCMQGLRAAVAHLHSLGLIHNDINPFNIMFTEEDVPILIDYDSCMPEGERSSKGGTFGWTDGSITSSTYSNDFFALNKIEKYLTSPSDSDDDAEVDASGECNSDMDGSEEDGPYDTPCAGASR